MRPIDGPSLVARVRRTIATRDLARPGSALVLAVSGGPDSLAMLDVLTRLREELGLRLAVASVDHGLRPEAAAEVEQVRRHADERSLTFRGLALGLAPGTSHADARDARYAALAACARELGCDAIAVAHTRDDQAETVLARLLRGSGLRGLRGVHASRADGVIRPLLDASRAEVEAHLLAHGLAAVSDPSNLDRRYTRVRIRRDLLPELAKESPAIAAHLAALADEAAELAEFVDVLARGFREAAGDTLHREALMALPAPARAAAIAEFVRFHGGKSPGRAVVDAVRDALDRGGSVWIGHDLALEGEGGALVVRSVPAGVQRSGGVRRPKE